MKSLFFSFLFLLCQNTFAQTLIKGRVIDTKNRKLPGANIMLKGTYDGASSDSAGAFRFKTYEKDTATLVVSFIGYEPFSQPLTLTQSELNLTIKLREEANELNTVVITAGAFEASDEKKMTMLKPLDIVTTAGAAADITGAMHLLPGAQRVGEQEGLFVRGGSGLETKVVIDGLIVQNPFFSSMPDLQSRGRFNPFMFKGTSFSTGGYSAQYGQAMSSVLLLNTTDKGNNNGFGLGANFAGVGLNYDRANEKYSLSVVGNYTNLTPFFKLIPQNVDWQKVPQGLGTSVTYRLKTSKTGLWKFYGMYSGSDLAMNMRNPENPMTTARFGMNNQNSFINSTYTDSWNEGKWTLNSGVSYSRNNDDISQDSFVLGRFDERLQGRVVLSRLLTGNNTLLFGTEIHRLNLANRMSGRRFELHENFGAGFVESEIYITRALAMRIGLRGEYSSLLNRANAAPRFSMAYKTGTYSQVSFDGGVFYQTPHYNYLYRNTSLRYERADHYIVQYQVLRPKHTFRIAGFYKNYDQLVREYTTRPDGTPLPFDANPWRFPWGTTNNDGYGYVKGFDVFWRDQKSVKGLDYWITYSFIDTKRLFMNYTSIATPTFASKHNLSVIGKKYFNKLQMSAGLTYTYTSGRPYYNPNHERFLTDLTPAVHNISFTASKLASIGGRFTVFYVAIDNLLGTQNVFTYRFTPDGQTRYAVGPQAFRTLFAGFSMSLSKKAQLTVNSL